MSKTAEKVAAVFERVGSGELRGHAFASDEGAAYHYRVVSEQMRGERPVPAGLPPPPNRVWFARVVRGTADGLSLYTHGDPTDGAGPFFVWAHWELFVGHPYSEYEERTAASMHATFGDAETRWTELFAAPKAQLFHLIIAAAIETTAPS